MIILVPDVKIARVIKSQTKGGIQGGAGGGAIIAPEGSRAISGDCSDNTAGGDLADAVVITISKVEIAGIVKGQASRKIQSGAGGRAAIAPEGGCAIAGKGSDNTARGNLANAVVIAVSNIKIVRAIKRHSLGEI